MSKVSPAIGIDLGTTYCCMAVCEDVVKIIHNDHGKNITPSYVSFTDKEILVGDAAKDLQMTNLKNTVYDVKRLIGRKFDDPTVKSDVKRWPFEVIEADSKIKVKVQYKGQPRTYYPEEISAHLLKHLKKTAEDFLGQPVKDAVITVPAYFNNSQRQATKFAGEIAGFNVLRIINEPSAAAIAYGLRDNTNKNIIIYDLGGGTFDVSIVQIHNKKLTVRATGGNTHLGGNDFDNTLADHLMKIFKDQHKIDVKTNEKSLQRLYRVCENEKKILSNVQEKSISIDTLIKGKDLLIKKFTREKFEELNRGWFQLTMNIVHECLREAHLDQNDIEEIVLIGGSTRIPKIEIMLQEIFKDAKIMKKLNPDEAVAVGAAVLAKQLQTSKVGEIEQTLIRDVTPVSLGLLVVVFRLFPHYDTIIEKNTAIPVKVTKVYPGLPRDKKLSIVIMEDDSMEKILGEFKLTNIPDDNMYCEVTYSIDADGILNVHAKDLRSDSENQITINHCGLWKTKDINRMKKNLN